MLTGRSIELALEEAQELVKPENLKRVLHILKAQGFIAHFEFHSDHVLIFESPAHRLEASFFLTDQSNFPGRKP